MSGCTFYARGGSIVFIGGIIGIIGGIIGIIGGYIGMGTYWTGGLIGSGNTFIFLSFSIRLIVEASW